MSQRWKLREIPEDSYDRFPDGDYTVGRGADPRLPGEAHAPAEVAPKPKGADAAKTRKPRSGSRKRALRTAAR
jgi:hypothetical protein